MIDFIHIGMPKAASTWLQDVYFSKHPDLSVLHNGSDIDPLARRQLTAMVRKLAYGAGLSYEPSDIWPEIALLAQEYSRKSGEPSTTNMQIGISHETLSGAWLSGRNARVIARTLCDCFPDTKVIIVIREQLRIIESSYKQYIRFGGTASLARFILDPYLSGNGYFDDDVRNTDLVNYFKFSSLIEMYQSLFGTYRVLVKCQEQIHLNQQTIADQFSDFLDVGKVKLAPRNHVNVGLSPVTLTTIKLLNRLFYTMHHRQLGPMILARLSTSLGRSRLYAEINDFGNNPIYMRQLSSMKLHHYITENLLSKADRRIPKPLSSKHHGFSFNSLNSNLQNWLVREFQLDNMKTRELTGLDLEGLGYAI